MKKTLFLYNDTGSTGGPKFFELPGDYSHLNRIYINVENDGDDDNRKAEELSDLIYEGEGKLKVELFAVPTKDWDFFVHCGFVA